MSTNQQHFTTLPQLILLSGIFLFLLLIPQGCGKKNQLSVDVSGIEIHPRYFHFEDALFAIPDSLFFKDFPKVYPEFSALFSKPAADSLLTAEMLLFATEPRFMELYQRKREVMGDLEREKQAIEKVLKHYRYYYPEAADHQIYTHIPGLDLSLIHMPITLNDTLAVICTDFYLGRDFEPYEFVGIPAYKRAWMEPSQIAPEFARQLAFMKAGTPDMAETLLDQMVYQGKILYFMDAMMPDAHDSVKIRYTNAQLEWCNKQQRHVWGYLISNNMLFSSDQNHSKLMILDAPFTSAFTEQSPGRLGHWFGWQIVKRYMEKNPELSVVELMAEHDSRKILNGSGYKPK
jgi:hypothetical protein